MDAINPAGTVSPEQKLLLGGSAAGAAPLSADATEIGAFVAALLAQTLQPATAASTAAASSTNETPPGTPPAPAKPLASGAAIPTVPILPDPRQVLAARQAPPGNALFGIAARSATTDSVTSTVEPQPAVTAALATDELAAALPVNDMIRVPPTVERDLAAIPRAIAAEAALMATAESPSPAPTSATLEVDTALVQTLNRLGDTVSLQQQAAVGQASALPVRDPALFAERLNQQVSVMLSQHAQHARLAVNPPDLGPVDVRVTVVGDEATVHLAAAHAATREALEEALPRLRAAFLDSGIALGNAGVFTEMPEHQHDPHRGGGVRPAADLAQQAHGALDEQSLPLARVRIGLVDAFV